MYLLNLPAGISFLTISAITTAVALAGFRFVRKNYSAEVLKENHEVAAIIFNAFGLLYGVVVAFVVFVTWSGYDDATKNLQMEANEADDIFHIAKAFPEPTNKIIQRGLMDYTASVYNDELKECHRGT
jgi:predicted nucleic acid-binding protein